MATQPTNLPVPSESPRDLKFNAGKIDEFVTSLVHTYVDRFGNEHYTIEGLRWLAQQAIAQYGWIPVGTFHDGATLTLPNQILKDTTDGEYYRWDGSLPKVVPAGSTPASTGGTGVGAWISVGDSTLRALLASATGAQQIGTNHRGTLQQDLDVIDIRTSGQDVNDLLAAGSDVDIDTQLSFLDVSQSGVKLTGRKGGSIVAEKSSIALNLGADDQSVSGLNLTGAGDVSPEDTSATYLLRVSEDTNGSAVLNSKFKMATMGVHLRKAIGTFLLNSQSEGMIYHPALNAGGYGILTEGAEDILILGGSSKGMTNDRHAIYISNEPSLRANKDIRIIGYRADHSGANSGGVDGARNMPMINVRIVDGLVIDDCQLRGGGQGINILNHLGAPQRISISNTQIIDITKTSPDDPCTGIATTFTSGNNPIVGLSISNVHISVRRANGVVDGARRPIGVNLSNVRQGNIVGAFVSAPPDCYPIVIDSCRDYNISNVIGLPGTGDGTALALIRFEGVSQDISVSQLAFPNRPSAFSGLDNVTNLTVDFSRKLSLVSTNGTITSSDPNSLMASASITGTGEITIVFKSHVTTQALDTAAIRGNRIGGPHVFANRVNRSMVCTIYSPSGSIVPLSTSTVGIDFVLSS
ncbi:hypothetical protein ACK3RA_001012 [Enterobacter hormaechei]